MTTFKSKKEIESAIRVAINAMLRIFECQTEGEQKSGDVVENNGVGFAGTDSQILTSFCKRYMKYGRLSEKQMAIVFKKIGKCAGQPTRLTIEKGMYVKEGGVWRVNIFTTTISK